MSNPAVKKKVAANKAPKEEAWKANFGGGKPGANVKIIASSFGEDPVTNKVKLRGVPLHEVSKKTSSNLGLTNGAEPQVVMAMFRAAFGTDCPAPVDIIPDGGQDRFSEVASLVAQAVEIHDKTVAAYNSFVEEAARVHAAMAEKAAEAGANASVKSESNAQKIKAQAESMIDDKLRGIDGVSLVDGRFILDSDVSDEAVASGLTTLSSMIGQSKAMAGGFALLEAQFAIAVEDSGKSWKSYYDLESDEQDQSAKRIGQAVKAIRRYNKIEADLPSAGISVIRNVMEAKYNKTDPIDSDIRCKKLCDVLKAYQEKNGKYPPQHALRDMISEAKLGVDTPARAAYVYVLGPIEDGDPIRVVGTNDFNKGLASMALTVIHVGSVSFGIEQWSSQFI